MVRDSGEEKRWDGGTHYDDDSNDYCCCPSFVLCHMVATLTM